MGPAAKRRARLPEQLALAIARDIVRGDPQPGEALPSEAEVSQTFGVSKTVVREAVQALSSMGMVSIRHGKLTRVMPSDAWDVLVPTVQTALRLEGHGDDLMRELYEVRKILEADAAELASIRHTTHHVTQLEALVAKMQSVQTGPDKLVEFLEVDAEFHDVISAATNNTVLRSIVRNILAVSAANWWIGTALTAEQLPTVTRQHAKVAKTIALGDAGAARSAMLAHLEWAQANDLEGRTDRPTRRRRQGVAILNVQLPSSPAVAGDTNKSRTDRSGPDLKSVG
jgi:GntR family transcriptional repressor for pyruvate dehydrogenase complex